MQLCLRKDALSHWQLIQNLLYKAERDIART